MGQAQPAPGYRPAGPWVIARRFRAASPGLAWVLGGAVVVLAAAAVVLTALAGQLRVNITAGVVIVLTFAGVGLLIARRQPGNPIGWMMVVFTLVYVLGGAASYYALLYYGLGHRGLPLAALAGLLGSVQVPSFAMVPVVILLFPHGRVPGRQWRWAVRAYAGLVVLALALTGGRVGYSHRTHESHRHSHQQQSSGAVAGQSASLAKRPSGRRDRDPRPVLRRTPGAQLAQSER